jgi:hypothetical protein
LKEVGKAKTRKPSKCELESFSAGREVKREIKEM